ncbi:MULTISPECIES: hypothetical protein [Arthrobacter]|uniref:Hydroxymethylpyrimidine pyrophosphatase n=2 Tax=Arthrobacter TaxID=1663 RepID=A0ABU9KLR5_9MICC|nr:hypothetical protein [Arthrobacter sp. YJM1]MDP5226511.1 hypothetical protein [Arthrobacter sp. YJM1]
MSESSVPTTPAKRQATVPVEPGDGPQPPLALLLDVDGPIASPVTRSVQDQVIAELLWLASRGVPVIFNTGRSAEFMIRQVVEPMLATGIAPGLEFLAICEKGATWFTFGAGGSSEVQVDQRFTTPRSYAAAIRELVARKYSEWMFFDETKLAMVSVEQHVGTLSADYLAQQPLFDADALSLMPAHAMRGIIRSDAPEQASGIKDPAAGHFLVDPTIISTDIEHARLGKDLGAWRALTWLQERGLEPEQWRTVGDSGTDYAMADWLEAQGHAVAHVDVRPADELPEKPYHILTSVHVGLGNDVINDQAGLAFLQAWHERLDG